MTQDIKGTPIGTPIHETPILGPPAHGKGGSVWPWLVGAAVAAGVLYLAAPALGLVAKKPGSAGTAAAAVRPIPCVVATARQGDMSIYLTGLGAVTAFNTVTLHTRVDGELVNVAFTEGQLVHAGDLLAEIDPRPYQVQLMSAEGKLQQDQANQLNAKANLDRFKSAKDAISDQQIDSMAATVTQFEGAMKSDQAEIENAKLQLVYCRITSPITGRIGLRLVDKGNLVHANDATGLAVVTQIQPISVIFPLPEDDLGQVLGKPAGGTGLPVELYDRDLKHRIAAGTLSTIDNQIDSSTATVRFKAEFANADGSLFPNQFVNARLLVDTRSNVVIVPTACVQRSPTATFVYVVKSGEASGAKPAESSDKSEKPSDKGAEKGSDKIPDEVEFREVVVGPTEGDEVVLEKGIAAGEVVVVEGVDKLQPGSKVLPKDPSASKSEKTKGEKTKGEKSDKADKGGKPEKDEKPDKAEKSNKGEKAPR